MFSTIVLVSLIIICTAVGLRRRRQLPLPPGPKGIPFVGNILQLPRTEPFKTYRDWSFIYGPVIYMHIFGREFVILNTLKAATDLFEKRSAIYSTRPRLVMAGELVGRQLTSVLFTMYGPRLKQARQIIHGWINPRSVTKYYSLQELGSYKLLVNLVESPQHFSEHVRHNAGSIVLKLVYGIETLPQNDPWIKMSEDLSKITAVASQPGRWLVDSFPFLRFTPEWFPGAEFKRWAKKSRKHSMELVRIPFDMVKEKVVKGDAPHSWTAEHLQHGQEKSLSPEDENILTCAAGSIYAGGIDTVVSLIRTFFLIMARHPEIQKKAQAEIDKVVGPHRLTNMDDRDSLPYVDCLIKELLRINAIVPLIPHSLDKDDVYEGYTIPKGAWVMVNLWAILHNPETYKDPERFNPDRFDPALGDAAELDPTTISFGLGRRFCPGYHLAQATIFLNITHVLSVFNISPSVNAAGEKVPPPLSFDIGHLSHPSPFQCSITPRDSEKVKMIYQAVEAAKQLADE